MGHNEIHSVKNRVKSTTSKAGGNKAAVSEEVLTLHLYGDSIERQRDELGARAFDKKIGDFGDPPMDEITWCFQPLVEESLACKDKRVVKLLRLLELFGSDNGGAIPYAGSTHERLSALFDATREERKFDRGDEFISADSIRWFLFYMEKNRGITFPEIVITNDGNLSAEWRESADQLLAIEFLPFRDVRYVVFARNSNDKRKIDRVAASSQVDTVLDNVDTIYNVRDWMLHS